MTKIVVLSLEISDEKQRKKAMKAVCFPGVDYIAVDIEDKKLTFVGDVDPVQVVNKLRKFCLTEIVAIEPVN